MSDIRLNWIGKIVSGDDAGWFVKVVDAGKKPGGSYLILTADIDIFDPKTTPEGSQGFDDWVENWESLEGYFAESKWVIEWLRHEPPESKIE